jgi:hypothetical protein
MIRENSVKHPTRYELPTAYKMQISKHELCQQVKMQKFIESHWNPKKQCRFRAFCAQGQISQKRDRTNNEQSKQKKMRRTK